MFSPMIVNMQHCGVYKSIFISIVVGVSIMHWRWIAQLIGIVVPQESDASFITKEYYVGLLAALVLGVLLPRYAIHCGVWLMFGPVVMSHGIFFIKNGIPNMWPVEIFLITVLTLPYITLSLVGAFVARRVSGSPHRTE